MTFFWISLKSCTHAHTKHNIGPRCTKLKEGSNHGAIYLLINVLSSLIKVKMTICWHRYLDGLGFIHVKLLQHIIGVLGLTYEHAILELLDLKSKEELQLTHHGHIKPVRHDPTKFLTKSLISTTKYYIIDIYLAHKNIIIDFVSE